MTHDFADAFRLYFSVWFRIAHWHLVDVFTIRYRDVLRLLQNHMPTTTKSQSSLKQLQQI